MTSLRDYGVFPYIKDGGRVKNDEPQPVIVGYSAPAILLTVAVPDGCVRPEAVITAKDYRDTLIPLVNLLVALLASGLDSNDIARRLHGSDC